MKLTLFEIAGLADGRILRSDPGAVVKIGRAHV